MKKAETVFKKGDLLLFLFLIIVALALLLFYLIPKEVGNEAIVKKDGEEIGRYPLSEDVRVCIGEEGGEYNILIIENGAAYIKEASCPDKLCSHQGKICEEGQTLICLPNRVSVIIGK